MWMQRSASSLFRTLRHVPVRRFGPPSSLPFSTKTSLFAKKGEIASLFCDSVFKRAFGMQKDNLQALLNAMYDEEDIKIVSIDNVEQSSVTSRTMIYDIFCTLSTGSRIIVEMQRADTKAQIAPRLIGYLSRDYSEQWRKGGKGYELIPVRVLALLGFQFDKKREKCGSFLQRYRLRVNDGMECAVEVADKFHELVDVTLVQLPLAPNSFNECSKQSEKWGLLLLDSSKSKTMSEIDPGFLKDESMTKVIQTAQIDKMTEEELQELAIDKKLEMEREAQIATNVGAESERDAARALAEQEKAAKEAAQALAEQEKAAKEQEKAAKEAAQALAEQEKAAKEAALEQVAELKKQLADKNKK